MIKQLAFASPFFNVIYLTRETVYSVRSRSILLNLASRPVRIQSQTLHHCQSVIVANSEVSDLEQAVLVEGFDNFESYGSENDLLASIRQSWPLAYDVRGEQRLKGVSHYMSPKDRAGNVQFSMYHSASVPLNVGLHREHSHCGDTEPKEIHTQIVGFGKMQQCLEQDPDTLYLEEMMAPGTTHKPMYDDQMKYPWHQYETITPSVFMAIEIIPE